MYTRDIGHIHLLRAAVLSVCVTAVVFLFLPLTELIVQGSRKYTVTEMETVHVSRKPPEMPEEKKDIIDEPAETVEMKSREPVKKQLIAPQPIQAGLDLDLRKTSGDFSLRFNLKPGISEENIVFEIKDVDTPPVPVVQLPPQYPMNARMRGIEGRVVLVFTVNTKGNVENVRVSDSEPGDIFVRAAINTVKRWKFKPGTKNGKPVNVKVSQPLTFKLSKE